jgi:hypothetical protein
MNGKQLHKYIALLFSIIILTINGCRGDDSRQEKSSNEQNPTEFSKQMGSNLVVFGPQYYERTTGKPAAETAQFSVEEPDLSYILHIYNGGADSHSKDNLSSAVVQLNGESVVTPEDFNKNVSNIEKPVTLSTDNIIKVELRGKPGSNMTIEILGPRLIATITDVMRGNRSLRSGRYWRESTIWSHLCREYIDGYLDVCLGQVRFAPSRFK